jgi:cbb3-type cytochrome oxidase subunit 3
MEAQEILSLADLQDIVVPAAPGWWPPAAGLWVLLIIFVLTIIAIGYRVYQNRRRNRYRQAGLLLLADAATEYEVSVVLKRVALAAYPREQVASLYGAEWVSFLQQSCPQSTFSDSFASERGSTVNQDLRDSAAAWIKHHRSEPSNRGTT